MQAGCNGPEQRQSLAEQEGIQPVWADSESVPGAINKIRPKDRFGIILESGLRSEQIGFRTASSVSASAASLTHTITSAVSFGF